MAIELKNFKISLVIILFSSAIIVSDQRKIVKESNGLEHITLTEPYSYHFITINATKGQALAGSWEVTPSLLSPTFLVFIINSESFEEWENSDNLTQAVSRVPSENMIYFYDPLFRIDDIPLDNYRADDIQVKVPYEDTWYLVMYTGATLVSLTFGWYISAIDAVILDIVLYSVFGGICLILVVIGTVIYLKNRRKEPEDEIEAILKEQEKERREGLTSRNLEAIDESDDDLLEK